MLPKDEVFLEIESLALSGEGVAKRDGLVFFVDGALPGEEVRSEVTKVEKNLIRAKTVGILRKSPDRIDPLCKHFGDCGGCSFQHLKYEKQLEIKRDELTQMFKHLGGFSDVKVEPVIPSPKPFHYRNSVAMSVREQAGTPYFGFIGKDNRSFITVENCPITEERINELFSHVKDRFKEHVPEKKRYQTSQIVIRAGTDGKFYTSIKKHPESSKALRADVFGKSFQYAGSAFFQVNYSILDKFVGAVKESLNPAKDSHLLDLYCGVGFFSICLAQFYKTVSGIEEGEDAIQFANENAKANKVQNAQFIAGRTEDVLGKKEFVFQKMHVIIDPPRVGMKREVIEFLLKMNQIEKIVYVSCNPATLIRDLQILSERFQIAKVQPLDMFPQTQHLEVLTLLLPKI